MEQKKRGCSSARGKTKRAQQSLGADGHALSGCTLRGNLQAHSSQGWARSAAGHLYVTLSPAVSPAMSETRCSLPILHLHLPRITGKKGSWGRGSGQREAKWEGLR